MDERPVFLDSLPPHLAPHFREGKWEAEIQLPDLTRLFRYDVDLGGWIWVHPGETDQKLEASQLVLLDWLIDDQEAIGRAVRDAVLRAMPKIRARFEASGMGPLPGTEDEVYEATRIISIHVHHVEQGSAILGIEIHCDWDEHGIGVLWRDGAVLGVGDGDAAMTDWIAKRAGRGEYDFLYPFDPKS